MLRANLLEKCRELGFDESKLKILRSRVHRMLDRVPTTEPEITFKPVVYCVECDTKDYEEDLIHDHREGQLICKYCGIVVNYNLFEDSLESSRIMTSENDFFSPQHRFETVMTGGSKKLRATYRKSEEMLKAPDGTTTERYKNDQRKKVYDFLSNLVTELNLSTDLVLSGKALFHKIRDNAARLHSPEAVMIVCLLMVLERV